MQWGETEPGVLILPSGRRVRGRSLGQHPAQAPEWGLYLLASRPDLEWPSRWVRWPDFWLPMNGADARDAIAEGWTRSATELVEVGCGGGVGRTGTVLAAMAVLDGLSARAAVSWVRSRYNQRAVETPWQRAWLSRVKRP